jgi:hypothetical protein
MAIKTGESFQSTKVLSATMRKIIFPKSIIQQFLVGFLLLACMRPNLFENSFVYGWPRYVPNCRRGENAYTGSPHINTGVTFRVLIDDIEYAPDNPIVLEPNTTVQLTVEGTTADPEFRGIFVRLQGVTARVGAALTSNSLVATSDNIADAFTCELPLLGVSHFDSTDKTSVTAEISTVGLNVGDGLFLGVSVLRNNLNYGITEYTLSVGVKVPTAPTPTAPVPTPTVGNPPCYLCGGDPNGTISNPDYVVDLRLLNINVTEATCAEIFEAVIEDKVLTESQCQQAIFDPRSVVFVQIPCGCSSIGTRPPVVSAVPTSLPPVAPTSLPTRTLEPTAVITSDPTTPGTKAPTTTNTNEPTSIGTSEPTTIKTSEPTITGTQEPTTVKTFEPTTVKTLEPTTSKTDKPSTSVTSEPTQIITAEPTFQLTFEPTTFTQEPTPELTPEPTPITQEPTPDLTPEPTPSFTPTPTFSFTPEPTPDFTPDPTSAPTSFPTEDEPTSDPTFRFTERPVRSPRRRPVRSPITRNRNRNSNFNRF